MATQLVARQKNYASSTNNQSTIPTTNININGHNVCIAEPIESKPGILSSPTTKSINGTSGIVEEITITPTGNTQVNESVHQNGTTILQHGVVHPKYILQAATTSEGVSVIDVVPIEQNNPDDPKITVSVVQNSNPTSPNGLSDSGSQADVTAQIVGTDTLPHYITVADGAVRSYAPLTTVVSDNGTPQNTYHVQYVESDMYTTNGQSQSQMAYPVYTVGDYGSTAPQYYTASTGNYTTSPTTTGTSEYIVPVDDGILASNQRDSPQTITQEVTYIQGQQTTPTPSTPTTSESECTPGISHATRISPATVAWLMDNYETAEGVSLPRSTLYNHYMRHCNENKLDAVNAASFGKLIRSVFTGLRTRRLGTRGNSKYHYYGIRVKPNSGLMSILEDKPINNTNQTTSNSSSSNQTSARIRKSGSKPETYEACAQYLGDGNGAIPIFPTIDLIHSMPEDVTLEDVDTLRSIYREHCEAFLDAILNLEFSTVESLWREFWRAQDNNNGDECEEEKYLSKYKLYTLSQCEAIQNFIKEVDITFYQNMVDVLIPDVLRPIPSSLTQAIRNFAKNLESWLASAMTGCPETIVKIKTSAVSAFSQTLRRYTSLNHLAQAARAVLQNSSQIAQMLNDLNRVDFHNVQEQASWVCQCDAATVQRLENDFKAALQQQNTLEQWASWLRAVVDNALEDYKGKSTFVRTARQFLLKWSFYSSMVIRDLTLRSAASFGSFHLIRLLYDEYMFYIVEHRVAEATHTSPIAVMGELQIESDQNNDESVEDIDQLMFTSEFEIKMESSPKRRRS